MKPLGTSREAAPGLVMQKVVGSSPIIRSAKSPAQGFFNAAPSAWRAGCRLLELLLEALDLVLGSVDLCDIEGAVGIGVLARDGPRRDS